MFNITFIHRENNHRDDSLAVSTSILVPEDSGNKNLFKVLTLYHLAVTDNEDKLQVFENGEQAQIFFEGSGEEKKDATIDPKKDGLECLIRRKY